MDAHAMRLAHFSIVARDAERLARFYRSVFGCMDIRPPRILRGERVSRGNGVPNSEIYSIWLSLPGAENLFLEFHQYGEVIARTKPLVNEPGYAHVAFEVADIRATRNAIIEAGGSDQGQITEFETTDGLFQAIYMRDPEDNVIELEQYRSSTA